MRGAIRNLVTVSFAAMLCAGGCASKRIASVEGPLTPYSAAVAAAGADADPTRRGPNATTVSTGSPEKPYRYDPGNVDPRLLDVGEPEQTWWDRMTEATSPKKVGAKFKEMIGRGPDQDVARHAYNEADLAFRERDYKRSAKFFKIAADRWPDSTLQEDALFMEAESYFQSNLYPKANDTYTKLVKKYENSRHLDMIVKRRFAIGQYWEQRSTKDPVATFNFKDKRMPFWDTVGHTVSTYESIRIDDPTGNLADDATMASANVYFLNGRWEDAAYHYDLVRTEHPQSKFQPQAHLLGMEAKLRSYQGPLYDAKPLTDAKKLGQSIQTQFMAQMPDERERIQKSLKKIEEQLAERDYAQGDYYEKTHHYTAARYYYGEVVKNHPQSQFADLAKARIEQVKDKPADPKDELELIARSFRRDPPPAKPAPGDAPTGGTGDKSILAGTPGGTAPPNPPTNYGAPGTAAPPGGPRVAQQPQVQP